MIELPVSPCADLMGWMAPNGIGVPRWAVAVQQREPSTCRLQPLAWIWARGFSGSRRRRGGYGDAAPATQAPADRAVFRQAAALSDRHRGVRHGVSLGAPPGRARPRSAIPPAYAKAYVRRNKTDPADAAAICEAVSRPSMRFGPIKSEAEQAIAAVHRVRDRLIGQRTMLLNALRGHMAEFGRVVSRGPAHVKS